MARSPAKRHVIANVRLAVGLSQVSLAKILGCAVVTLQRVEQVKLPLSEALAAKAQAALDISAAWLLANDPMQPAITPRGGRWTKDFYELTQGTPKGHSYRIARSVPKADAENSINAFTALKAAEAAATIHAMMDGAKGRSKQGVLFHRLNKVLEELKKDFPPSEGILEIYRPEIEKLRLAYKEISEKIYGRESEELWSKSPHD